MALVPGSTQAVITSSDKMLLENAPHHALSTMTDLPDLQIQFSLSSVLEISSADHSRPALLK